MKVRKVLIGLVTLACAAAVWGAAAVGHAEEAASEKVEAEVKATGHVDELTALLGKLEIDEPRRHKHMVVFPIRWTGEQARGQWETYEDAVGGDRLVISEKSQASVPEVVMENTGDRTVLVLSGEIIAGGKQTRVVRTDTIIEPKQRVDVPVFCVEQGRWHGDAKFARSANLVPNEIRKGLNSSTDQSTVWRQVQGYARRAAESADVPASATQNLDETLEAAPVREELDKVHKDLGKFSPPETVGIAVADARSGRVLGVELFGRRDLFDRLQRKLVEGYATDLVVVARPEAEGEGEAAEADVPRKAVREFLDRALAGSSQYENTAGSGRGIKLDAEQLAGRGVALGGVAVHVSIQDVRPEPTPVRPIVGEQRIDRPMQRRSR